MKEQNQNPSNENRPHSIRNWHTVGVGKRVVLFCRQTSSFSSSSSFPAPNLATSPSTLASPPPSSWSSFLPTSPATSIQDVSAMSNDIISSRTSADKDPQSAVVVWLHNSSLVASQPAAHEGQHRQVQGWSAGWDHREWKNPEAGEGDARLGGAEGRKGRSRGGGEKEAESRRLMISYGSQLTILSARPSDNGQYACAWKKGADELIEKSAELTLSVVTASSEVTTTARVVTSMHDVMTANLYSMLTIVNKLLIVVVFIN